MKQSEYQLTGIGFSASTVALIDSIGADIDCVDHRGCIHRATMTERDKDTEQLTVCLIRCESNDITLSGHTVNELRGCLWIESPFAEVLVEYPPIPSTLRNVSIFAVCQVIGCGVAVNINFLDFPI